MCTREMCCVRRHLCAVQSDLPPRWHCHSGQWQSKLLRHAPVALLQHANGGRLHPRAQAQNDRPEGARTCLHPHIKWGLVLGGLHFRIHSRLALAVVCPQHPHASPKNCSDCKPSKLQVFRSSVLESGNELRSRCLRAGERSAAQQQGGAHAAADDRAAVHLHDHRRWSPDSRYLRHFSCCGNPGCCALHQHQCAFCSCPPLLLRQGPRAELVEITNLVEFVLCCSDFAACKHRASILRACQKYFASLH